MILFAAIFAGMLFFFGCLLWVEYMQRSRKRMTRLRRYAGGQPAGAALPLKQHRRLADRLMNFIRYVAQHISKLRRAQNFDITMQRAGLPLLGSEYVVIVLLSALLAALFTMMLVLEPFAAGLVFAAVILTSRIYVHFRIERRRRAFTNQLGDTLTMVSNAMRAGFSFMQAMQLISAEMEDPISGEFKQVLREISFGTTLENALLNMGNRMGSPDFDLVVTAVLIQRQVGGNLAQILDTISTTINDRIRMRREILALTAQGRMSGWILAALPIAVAAVLSFISPHYLQPLLDEKIGHIAIGGAIISVLIGIYVIQRIVDIDV
jgi:tight adherence protein B